MSERWQSASPDETLWAEWNGLLVVFHRRSGKTHVLNGPTATLLRTILTRPKSLEAAARELSEGNESIALHQGTIDHISHLIEQLEQMGLVERV